MYDNPVPSELAKKIVSHRVVAPYMAVQSMGIYSVRQAL